MTSAGGSLRNESTRLGEHPQLADQENELGGRQLLLAIAFDRANRPLQKAGKSPVLLLPKFP